MGMLIFTTNPYMVFAIGFCLGVVTGIVALGVALGASVRARGEH